MQFLSSDWLSHHGMTHYKYYGNCTRLRKIKNKLKISCFNKLSVEEFSIFCGRF